MSNLSILRNSLKLNADVINLLQCATLEFKIEAVEWKKQGETAYFIEACNDRRKHKAKLVKAVEMQKRIKAEISALFRGERIKAKYARVFGQPVQASAATSYEQEAMLDALLAERQPQNEPVFGVAA